MKSLTDIIHWFETEYEYENDRIYDCLKYHEETGKSLPCKNVEQLLTEKKGLCFDSTYFIIEMLKKIDIDLYRPDCIFLFATDPEIDIEFQHYVCIFYKENEMWVMDYGNKKKHLNGVHGPFKNIEEYKKFYEDCHPNRNVVSIKYGWPPFRNPYGGEI